MQVMRLDLADTSSVVEFGKAYSKLGVPLHILINNAGLFAMSAPRTTGDGNFEIHLLTNFISGALLTLLLLPPRGGHLDVLKYARKNGCPWDKSGCYEWARTEEMKAWIQSQPN